MNCLSNKFLNFMKESKSLSYSFDVFQALAPDASNETISNALKCLENSGYVTIKYYNNLPGIIMLTPLHCHSENSQGNLDKPTKEHPAGTNGRNKVEPIVFIVTNIILAICAILALILN